MNDAPDTATELVLVSVMVSTDTSPVPIEAALKDFATVRRAITASVAEAPADVPALVVLTAPLLFTYEPSAALVTLTVMVHVPLAGTVAPERATLVPLLAAVTVPPHDDAPAGVAVFTRPTG